MVPSKASSSSTPAMTEQPHETTATSVGDSRPRIRAERVATPVTTTAAAAAAPAAISAANDTQATVDRFLTRMLAKPGTTPSNIHRRAATAPPDSDPSAFTSGNRGEEQSAVSQSSSALATSTTSQTPGTTASAASSSHAREAHPPAATTPPPTDTSSEAKQGSKDNKGNKDRKTKAKPKETTISTLEALRGTRRKPLSELSAKDRERPQGASDGSIGRDRSPAVASSSSPVTSSGSLSPPRIGRTQISKEPSIIHVSSQPSFSEEQETEERERPRVIYTIDSTLTDDDPSMAILPDPTPALPAKQNTETDDSLASHIPSVNRSIISRWIGDVAGEANRHPDLDEEEEDGEADKHQSSVQEKQQSTTSNPIDTLSGAATLKKPALQTKHSVALSSSPILTRAGSDLPLAIATPTPKTTVHHSTGEGTSRGVRPGTKVLVPDSLPHMPSWMDSLPEDDDNHDIEYESNSHYHQPWQSRPDDLEGPTPSTLGSEPLLPTLPEGVSATPGSGQVLSSLPTTQQMQGRAGEKAMEELKVSPKARRAAHGLPAGLTSSFLEELGVRPDELTLQQGALQRDEVAEGSEEEDGGYHRRKRAKRGGRTEELMYEMEYPRRELPLDMTGTGHESNHNLGDSTSLQMGQRDMFPSTLGSLPLSSYQSSQEGMSSDIRHRGASSRELELDQVEGNTGADAGGSVGGTVSKQGISGGGPQNSVSSKDSGSPSLESLPLPPTLSFGDNVSASYVDELAAIAEQMSEHDSS